MGTILNLNPNPGQGLEEFCRFLYGEETGFVHVPIKDNETGQYHYEFFFKWPLDRHLLYEHVARYAKHADVFITPGMFKTRSSSVAESYGSNVAWADFDGNVPSLDELHETGVPLPTVRVQSSVPGREHWYWKFDQFNTDIVSLQQINKAISYALEGDTGAWDAGHSLRPVGTLNHKHKGLPVLIISHNENRYRIEDFSKVPVPQESYNLEQFRKEQTPNPLKTMLRHGPWQEDTMDLLTKHTVTEGYRSSALTRLAYECCEHGLDNSEVYSLLQWVDKRWRKFYDRENREKYYVDLVNYARQKVPYEGIKDVPILADELPTFGFKEVLSFVDDTQWIIEGILPYKGTGYVVGRSGTGKTTLTLGITTSLALNKRYLDWGSNEDKNFKILYLSLEMTMEDVNNFYSKLQLNFTEEELDLLQENFHTYASPEKIKFYQQNSPTMGKFLRKLENLKPDIILVDSASYSLASNLNVQQEVTESIELIDKIKDKYECTFLFIHHSRKEPPGHGYKEADLDDVFGSAFIAASAAGIIALKQSKDYSATTPLMDVRYLKTRFSAANEGFSVIMDGDKRIFKRPSMGELMASTPIPEPKTKGKKNESRSFFDV